MEPPNLRIHDAPAAGEAIKACGNCIHFGFTEDYDPGRSRDQGGRRKRCKKFDADVSPSEVCDEHSRARSY